MKHQFSTYLNAINLTGSGKASSYIRALDLLSQMLMVEPFGFEDCIDIWNMTSLKRVSELKTLVAVEQHKKKKSVWLQDGIAQSYLINGYCHAALTSYERFLAEFIQENDLLEVYENFSGSGTELSKSLDTNPRNVDIILNGLKNSEGEDVIRSVKTRLNQNIFRRILMDIYGNTCCVTGLDIDQINRASHIVPWAKDPSKRLDPTNGIYLSATYDAAFDQHLMSLDDDYRIILSKNIKDHYSSESVRDYFLKKEGQVIRLPYKYYPNKHYLSEHRNNGDF